MKRKRMNKLAYIQGYMEKEAVSRLLRLKPPIKHTSKLAKALQGKFLLQLGKDIRRFKNVPATQAPLKSVYQKAKTAPVSGFITETFNASNIKDSLFKAKAKLRSKLALTGLSNRGPLNTVRAAV
jgi:hypothetical protein